MKFVRQIWYLLQILQVYVAIYSKSEFLSQKGWKRLKKIALAATLVNLFCFLARHRFKQFITETRQTNSLTTYTESWLIYPPHISEGGVQINFLINQTMPMELVGFEPGAAAWQVRHLTPSHHGWFTTYPYCHPRKIALACAGR